MPKKGPTKPKPWTPLVRSTAFDGIGTVAHRPGRQVYGNAHVTVLLEHMDEEKGHAGWLHISVHLRTRSPMRDWRMLQRIKNEIAGPEREGFEAFPAESRLVDASNEYHIWVLPEGDRLPVGWEERYVRDQDEPMNDVEIEYAMETTGRTREQVQRTMKRTKQRRL